MPQTIYIKDYDTEVSIPDGADMSQVQAALKKQFPPKTAAPTATQIEPTQKPSIVQQATKYVRPALEMGGMLAGGALAAPTGPVGMVAGAGLGYAGGRQAANLLEQATGQRKSKGVARETLEAAKDVGMGAAMEAGGAVLGLPVQKGLQALGKAAPRLYESVAKIPPRSVPKTTREQAVKTAFEHKIPATQKGYAKLRSLIEETNTKIAKVIDDAEEMSQYARSKNLKSGIKEYEEDMIRTQDILSRLNDVKNWARESFPDPLPITKAIDKFKFNISKTRGGQISVKEAQKLKQGIYRRLTDAAYGEYSTAAKEMDKAFARGIKEELVAKYPILQKLNAKDSSLIRLQNILERTVNRTRNWDIAGLSDIAGSGVGAAAGMLESGGDFKKGGMGAAAGFVLARGLRSPAVMSQLAFALNKASRIGTPKITPRAISYAAGKLSGAPDIPAEEIVGNVLNKITPSASAETKTPAKKKTEPLSAAKRGIEAYTNNDWTTAIREWQKALKEEPKNAIKIIGWINTAKEEKKKYKEFMLKQKSKSRNITTAQLTR
jgi:hypothetical protein